MTPSVRELPLDDETAGNVAGLAAFAISFVLLISGRGQDLLSSTPRLFLLLVLPAALTTFWMSRRPLPVISYLAIGCVLLRLADFPSRGAGGSDVLAGTHEAITTLLHAHNPYAHFYVHTRPPGQPFPYPPASLFVHLPGYLTAGLRGMQATQVALAVATFALFGWVGAHLSWLVGLPAMALYAGAPNLINLSIDGSNDTAVGFFLVAALIAVMWALGRDENDRAIVAAGLVGGVAVGMKQTAAPIVLAVAVYLWRRGGRRLLSRYAVAAAGVLVLISIPFLVMGPLTYLKGLVGFVGAHGSVYGWNVWTYAHDMGWPVWAKGPATVLNLIATAAGAALVLVLPYRRLAGAVLAGVVLTLVLILTARWTSYAYFAALEPVVLLLPALALWDRRHMLPSAEHRAAEIDTWTG